MTCIIRFVATLHRLPAYRDYKIAQNVTRLKYKPITLTKNS